jgi:crotonobetainyl-CoA:carnitine CoA-transferase CaiB-like acyl-CoA transferase
MTERLPSGRLPSVRLLPATPVTILGRAQTARTAADILRSVGAEVTAIDANRADVDLRQLEDDETVVCDIVHEGADAGYLAAVAARRRGAWVTVSAFGLDGPLGGRPGTDLLCAAAGGLLGAVTDTRGAQHLMPGSQALRVGGQAAALAALHAISLVRSGQEPLHLDLSVQEAVAFCTVQQETAQLVFECGGKLGASRYSAPSGYFTCTDGEILIIIIDDHQMVRFAEVIDRPDWPAKYPRNTDRDDHTAEINEVVQAWTATRSKLECEHLLQGNGVAATAVRTLREAVTNEQYRGRDFLLPEDDMRLSFGTLPALVTPLPPGAGPRGQGGPEASPAHSPARSSGRWAPPSSAWRRSSA